MNVVLIGYRGTGKSTVGKVIAARLGCELLSTDAEIVKSAGQTIPQIVEQHGWEYFRDLETKMCQGLAGKGMVRCHNRGCHSPTTECRHAETHGKAVLADGVSGDHCQANWVRHATTVSHRHQILY